MLVRRAAKIVGLTGLLVENTVILFLLVLASSLFLSQLLLWLRPSRPFQTGRAWIELDLSALRHNVNQLQSILPENCTLMPAVKANAYGHGAVLIAKELNHSGIRSFCVATVSEGMELRRGGVKGEILVLGYTHPEQVPFLRKYRLTQTVIDMPYARFLNSYGKKLKVHLKIDTGMHRLGISADQQEEIASIFQMKNLVIEGIFAHLCVADEETAEKKAFTLGQAEAFQRVICNLNDQGLACGKTHLLSSYGLLRYPELAGDYARVGIALYGILSNRRDLDDCQIALHPVLSLKLEALKDTNYIKTIVTLEDKMDLERKSKQSVQGNLYVRFLCFGNGSLSALHDRSYGFYRRQIILTVKDVPPDRVDEPYLIEKLQREADDIFFGVWRD